MAEELKWDQVGEYLTGLVPPRDSEMRKMEAYAAEEEFPIIGPTAGYFCYQAALLVGAKNVFELQQAELVIAPSIRSEGKLMQKAQQVGMWR